MRDPLVIDDRILTERYAGLRTARQSETALHRTADTFVAPMETVLRRAFAKARVQIQRLFTDAHDVVSYDEVIDGLQKTLTKNLGPMIHPMVVAGGATAAKMLTLKTAELRTAKSPSTKATVELQFDAKSQAAIDWADRHAGELIDGITETTREAISNATAEYLETGDWEGFKENLLDAVGDEDRANLIARHESMLAVHEGQRQAWNQAVDEGLLTGDEKRTWLVVGDGPPPSGHTCPICLGLEDKQAELDGVYVGDDGEQYDGPPAHVRCRCTEGLS